jgi:hypothetical protein
LFGGLDAGQLGDGKDIAFADLVILNQMDGFGCQVNDPRGSGAASLDRFTADIHHLSPAALIGM